MNKNQEIVMKLLESGLKCPEEVKGELGGTGECCGVFGVTDYDVMRVMKGPYCPVSHSPYSCNDVIYAGRIVVGFSSLIYENRTEYQVFKDLMQIMLKDDLDKDLHKLLNERLDSIIQKARAYDKARKVLADGKSICDIDIKYGEPVVKTE